MKKIITLLILLIAFQASYSQKHEKRKKIKALKTAHITSELDLSSKEAEKFWPIYNASQEKEHSYRKKMHELRKRVNTNITENEAQVLLDEFTTLSNKTHNTRRKLLQDLKSVLPAKKLILLHKAEEEFKRKLFKQFKERQRPGGPPRGKH